MTSSGSLTRAPSRPGGLVGRRAGQSRQPRVGGRAQRGIEPSPLRGERRITGSPSGGPALVHTKAATFASPNSASRSFWFIDRRGRRDADLGPGQPAGVDEDGEHRRRPERVDPDARHPCPAPPALPELPNLASDLGRPAIQLPAQPPAQPGRGAPQAAPVRPVRRAVAILRPRHRGALSCRIGVLRRQAPPGRRRRPPAPPPPVPAGPGRTRLRSGRARCARCPARGFAPPVRRRRSPAIAGAPRRA